MKKLSFILIALLLVSILSAGTVFAETAGRTVNLVVGSSAAQIDGQNVTMTAPAQVISGKTLVPLRFIGEAFDCGVDWIASTRTATVTLGNLTIEVPIGQNYAMVDGEKTDLDVPGQLINGSTYVPLRFISESLGAKVDYNAATKGISILLNTFKNKDHNFEMVLPAGWTADVEAKEGISFTNGADGEAIFALIDETDGVKPSDTDAAALFEDYKDKEGFNYSTEENVIVAAYQEEGVLNMIAYVYLDSGVYVAMFDAPTESFDDAFSAQCALMMSTMRTYEQ